MKISDLKKKQIISRDGHFIPIVFVDVAISAHALTVGAALAGRELNKKLSDKKFLLPKINNNSSKYTPFNPEAIDIDKLSLSIEDITY